MSRSPVDPHHGPAGWVGELTGDPGSIERARSPRAASAAVDILGMRVTAWVIEQAAAVHATVADDLSADQLTEGGHESAALEASMLATVIALVSRSRFVTPDEALDQVRWAARQGLPIDAVLRGIWTAHAGVQNSLIDAATATVPGDQLAGEVKRLSSVLLEAVSTLSRSLSAAFELESAAWGRDRASAIRTMIDRVLDTGDQPADAEETLGVRLSDYHLAAVIDHADASADPRWRPDIARWGEAVRDQLDSATVLVIPRSDGWGATGQAEQTGQKYFIEGDFAFSHLVATLSGAFPPGEEGFIRSVRAVADDISDPVLKKRIAGFIGQESVHGSEHRRLNQRLVEMGYRIKFFESPMILERRKRVEQKLGRRAHLAGTAAAEHYTAVLAENILSREELQRIPGDPEVWNLLNWHALEELEHKSVAFDVYRAIGGTERMRIGVMFVSYVLALPMTVAMMVVGLALDPIARRHPLRCARQVYGVLRGPFLKGMMPQIAKYLRPGFHPNDHDTSALEAQWRERLFGTEGALVDRLK